MKRENCSLRRIPAAHELLGRHSGARASANPESRDSGFDAEPVIGPRLARTRWHRPGMTVSVLLRRFTLQDFKQPRHSYKAFSDMRSRPRGAMRPSRAFIFRPLEGVGNAGCPLHPRPRVHFVLVESTRVTTSTPESPGIPARNGFTAYVALPGDRALLPPSSADMSCLSPVGPTQLRELDASVGASGPHDFAVRSNISRQRAGDRSRLFRPALRSHRAQNAAASTATHPAFLTIMTRPLCGVGCEKF
jgi:hypothetical protein